MVSKSALLGSAALITCAVCCGPAMAADPAAPAADSHATTDTALSEVVVTARRKEEDLQKVPVAVTAFSQTMLKERSISDAMDLSSAVPALNVEADSGRGDHPIFAIRGMGQDFGAAAGSVETYFAEVPLSGPFQMPAMGPSFFDLQSLQVLEGPQGTLFGRSTTGGAVLIVPQAPTDTYGGYFRGQVGNYNDVQLEGAVNLPLAGDAADLRLAGFDWGRAGYGRTIAGNRDVFGAILPSQTYDNQDVQEFRATLLLKPTDRLQNSTIFAYHRDDDRNTEKATVLDPSTALGGGIAFLYPNLLKLSPYVADIDTNLDHPPSTNWALINTTTYELTDDLTVKNIFGYIDAKGVTDVAADVDGSPLAAIDLPTVPRVSETMQTTDELQLQGHEFGGRLSWVVGGLLDQTRQPGGNNIGVIITETNAAGGITTDWQQNRFTNYAVYGSATYKLTDQLNLTAGERHSWNDVSVLEYSAELSTQQYEDNNGLRIGNVPAGQLAAENNSARFSGDTYNVGLDYQATSDTMVYGGYRRGYKQGGFNISAPIAVPSEQGFQPESDDDFYLGVKTSFHLGGVSGHFDLEGYYDLYHDKQESYLTLTGSGAASSLATVTYNVPQTTYRGIDLDFVADLTDWLRATVNYSYIDAYYTKWPDATFAATTGAPGGPFPDDHLNLAVNPVGFVSPNKVSFSTRFHDNLADDRGELAFIPTVTYQDRWYTIGDAFLLPQGETAWLGLPTNFNSAAHGGDFVNAYALLNLRFEWNKVWGSPIDAAVNVTNVTNKAYSVGDTTSIAFGVQSDSFGPPRMVTFELSTKF